MRTMNQRSATKDGAPGKATAPEIDCYRSIVFPNAVRQLRRQHGMTKLLALAAQLPDIPYIRLSKIERGEVVAKAAELRRIAAVFGVRAEDLLIDIDAHDFDIAEWAAGLQDWTPADPVEDRFAVALAAAIRARRESDKTLSIASIERVYGIAPVILSRLENAYKTIDRWNAQTVRAVCSLMGVADVAELRDHVERAAASGALDGHLASIANPAARIGKTRAKVAALRQELCEMPLVTPIQSIRLKQPVRQVPVALNDTNATVAAIHAADVAQVKLVPVFGAPLPDGLLERVATGQLVEAPRGAGPRTYGLRVCRATLGPGLPAQATVVVDPDRFPSSGGIAVVTENGALRLVIVTFDRQGRMVGYSTHPDREFDLDGIDPANIAKVVSVSLD